MNWRWLRYDYIPPELELSSDLCKGIRKKARSDKHLIVGKGGFLRLFIWLIIVAGWYYLLDWLMGVVNASGLIITTYTKVIMIYSLAIGVYVSHCLIFSPTSARVTYEILRQSVYDICTRCGYWLKGLDDATDHCPECGTKREFLSEHASEEHADLH